MGSVSWSMEISYNKHPPASQILTYYNWNYPSMIAMIEYSGYGLQGTVTDASTGDPVAAVIMVNNYFPTYSDPTSGDYHKYVLDGIYSITVIANGYESQIADNIVVNNNSVTTANFQLIPQTNHYVYKFAASQIENNNHFDEGWTPGVIGPPDLINYSIGKGGWCVLDMQYPMLDDLGSDFIVYEGDITPEGYDCYVGETIDGPWITVGSGIGTTAFDLITTGLTEAQFIKIVDDNDGLPNIDNAGFDLDAVEIFNTTVPVELLSFNAKIQFDDVLLVWRTATELNNYGFQIERMKAEEGRSGKGWEKIMFVEGAGNSTKIIDYSFLDTNPPRQELNYRLKQIDLDGTSQYSKIIKISLKDIFPSEFKLSQNYPNPFNPQTEISYSIAEAGYVELIVFDPLGQEVEKLVQEYQNEGNYKVTFNTAAFTRSVSSRINSGVYFYQLKSGNFVDVKKMIIAK
jgi:hypothetical protein